MAFVFQLIELELSQLQLPNSKVNRTIYLWLEAFAAHAKGGTADGCQMKAGKPNKLVENLK